MREEKDSPEGLTKHQPNRAPPVPRPLHQNSPAQTITRETGRRVWAVNRLTLGSQPTYPGNLNTRCRPTTRGPSPSAVARCQPTSCPTALQGPSMARCPAEAIHGLTLNTRCQPTTRGPRSPEHPVSTDYSRSKVPCRGQVSTDNSGPSHLGYSHPGSKVPERLKKIRQPSPKKTLS